jgi:hypothetical protein
MQPIRMNDGSQKTIQQRMSYTIHPVMTPGLRVTSPSCALR